MLEKIYNPAEMESRIYEAWEGSGAFRCGQRRDAEPFCIVIPPPNVTGSLHMGHALNNTLQDVLVRFERMRGKDVLWQPGTDHAGIATQMVVERQLAAEGNVSRREMGREAFVARVWHWKEKSGGTIVRQLKRLGASCDWSRERFTMDEGLSRAVLKVFVQLYKEGLIYKDKRLVNWDPKLLTAISDLEVENKEMKGHLWYLRYPLADGLTYEQPIAFDEDERPTDTETRDYIVVATTRPETMLGDTGVAVHPDDKRYQGLIGKFVNLPLVGRRIPIVADSYSDPSKGTGAVKITPAHDLNDFEVGRRHDLEPINIFTPEAKINDQAAEKYRGMDRFDARKAIVEDLDALGLLDKVEDHVNQVPFGDRSNDIIEPYLTEQWYVNAEVLARPAIAAVEQGRTKFVPKTWEKTYFNWMRNIQPWCISRQLWWGHQIPAWYGPDGHVFVEESEEEARAAAELHYGQATDLTRDEDVLDTWFSSALWPFSTLGWPDDTPELNQYYPTTVLSTAHDIIFFWVARMMMFGLHFMKEVPFDTVYIHAIVKDEKGQKMSKSKGNIIDPLEMIDRYGADALRFTMAALAAQGRDVKIADSRVEGYRNFGTKLWNAARFCEMNECVPYKDFDPASVSQTLNTWIVAELGRTEVAVRSALEAYRFNEAAAAVYEFTWGVFCDWFLEFAKPLLSGNDPDAQTETRRTAAWVLDQILKLLHPFMPFLTEELWTRIGERAGGRDEALILTRWPETDEGHAGLEATEEMNAVVALISAIRSVRAEMRVPPSAQMTLYMKDAGERLRSRLQTHEALIKRLARISDIRNSDCPPKGSLQIVFDEAILYLPVADVIDIAGERARLAKEIDKAEREVLKIEKKLANESFLAKAPQEVVEEQRERREEGAAVVVRLKEALKTLDAAG